jgi:hypothetical protein
VVAIVWGSVQFYIWYKHGEIGARGVVGFVVLVVILFASSVIHLRAARAAAGTHGTTTLAVDGSVIAPSIPIAEQGTTISISPQELVLLFKTGGTTAQGNRLIQPYVGKWMQISGVVNLLYA